MADFPEEVVPYAAAHLRRFEILTAQRGTEEDADEV
jgi:hypothetical protein